MADRWPVEALFLTVVVTQAGDHIVDRDQGNAVEAIIAAILTTASVEPKVHSVGYVTRRYAEVLTSLRERGGYLNPKID
jgi:hypothetical protein